MPRSANLQPAQALYRLLLAKLEQDWERFSAYGTTFAEAANSLNLARAVRNDILQELRRRGLPEDVCSEHTLYRMFSEGKLSDRAQLHTRNALSQYLGFADWDDFLRKHQTDQQSTQQKRYRSRWQTAALGLIGLLLLLSSGRYTWQQYRNRQAVRQVIRQANAWEFERYRLSPKIDTTGAARLFHPDGPALQSILGILQRSADNQRRLLQPPSSFSMKDIRIKALNQQRALVETEEYWKIRWLNQRTGKQLLYDTLNTHEYLLRKNNGRWRIQYDYYQGQARKPVSK